jgi:large subunit ribosomal protein L30e
MAEIEKTFKNIVKNGSVVFGFKQTHNAILNGNAKLVVLSDNCPRFQELTSASKQKKIPIYTSKVDSVELGYLCGRAYTVSTFAVLDDGGINIHQMLKKG